MDNVRRHPDEGARLLGPLNAWLGPWALAVEQHHERFDGRGYPRGIAGDQISLAGRIVAVADSYEVMTAVRPYRKPIGVCGCATGTGRCSGAQFDPVVVRAFLNISMGRLWRVVGIGSWIAQLPVIGWVDRLGWNWGAAIMSGTTAIGLTAPGVAAEATPCRADPGDLGRVDRRCSCAERQWIRRQVPRVSGSTKSWRGARFRWRDNRPGDRQALVERRGPPVAPGVRTPRPEARPRRPQLPLLRRRGNAVPFTDTDTGAHADTHSDAASGRTARR